MITPPWKRNKKPAQPHEGADANQPAPFRPATPPPPKPNHPDRDQQGMARFIPASPIPSVVPAEPPPAPPLAQRAIDDQPIEPPEFDGYRLATEESLLEAEPIRLPGDAPTPRAAARSAGRVSVEDLGATIVATVIDSEVAGEDAAELSAQILAAMSQAGELKHLVLDLQNVNFMDSMCLNQLLALLRTLQQQGKRIAVASATHSMQVLFKLTQLDRVFPLCRDVMSAITAVERAAA